MSLTLDTAPASLADSMLQDVCDHLRQVAALDDSPAVEPADLAHIERLTESAVALLDGPNGKLRRALLTQTWTATFDYFCIDLPLRLPPVQSVTSVKYVNVDGDLTTLNPSAYRLTGAQSWDPVVSPAYGTTWPETRDQAEAVTVEFVAGYGEAADVPREIMQAIRLLVAEWYAEREAVGFSTPHELPHGVAQLIQPLRIYR